MDGKIRIDTELETKSFEAQYKLLEEKLNRMVKTLETENQIPIHLRMSESERLELESAIEKTKNQLIAVAGRMNEVGKESDESGARMEKNFKKGVSSLKKFALSLFGLRSIFALVSRASNAYLSQNTELANKLQSVWVGLGSFLAPFIEWLSDVLLKGLGYLNEFIKALTGIDFIANANAKAIKKQATAQQQLNKQTASFDEMNVLQSNSDAGAGGGASSGLIDIPNLNPEIVKTLQNMAYWLKENWDWISKVGIALGVVFGVSKIAGWLGNISSLIGSNGTGLIGIVGALKGLATIGVIAVGVNFIYDTATGRNLIQDLQTIGNFIKDYLNNSGALNEQGENSVENTKAYVKETNDLVDAKRKEALAAGKNSHELQMYVDYLYQAANSADKTAERERELSKSVAMGSEAWEGYNRSATANENLARDLRERIRELNDAELLNNEQKLRYLPLWGKWNTATEIWVNDIANGTDELGELTDKIYGSKDATQGLIDKEKELGKELNNTTKKNYTIKQTVKTEFATPDVSKLESALKKFGGIGVVGGILGGAMTNIKLATGGIINNPGRGVSLGNGITGGEAGAEGVIPLTDSQAMETLGAAIGKYITVNANITNTMNGRVISRELQKVNSNSGFATNS